MHTIGIVGGVASGKSLVAEQLARLGAGVLDADAAGHEVLRLPEVEHAVRQRWGAGVFDLDGRIDRNRVARLVFADPPNGPLQRRWLEALTHPAIGRVLRQRAEAMAGEGTNVVVLDAPLLLEAGWDRLCDRLVFVDCPRPVRLSRALARGWNEEEFSAREEAQETLDFKRSRADVVLDNSGPPEQTWAQVERLWRSLFD